ncbi:MerR family transcriptional regulator [Ehrlichia sp. JZT12]
MRQSKQKNDSSRLQTIGEVAKDLNVEQYVLRFWEDKFPQINPIKRRGRRLYSKLDVDTLKYIKYLLYDKGYKIKGVQQELNKINAVVTKDDNYIKQDINKENLVNLLNDVLSLKNYLLEKLDGM